jgi:GNAT superfamily N-acetyltransferase
MLQITEIDLRRATEREYAALNDFRNQLQAERVPEDPPMPLEEMMNWWREVPPLFAIQNWIVWSADGAAIIANAETFFWRTEENQHAIDIDISILPAYRRQGLARRLLATAADFAEQQNRRTLLLYSNDRVPSGEAFLKRIGAERGMEAHTNQLVVDELDHHLVERWIQQAAERANGFELGFWDETYPEEQLEAIARLIDVMNTAPRGTLNIEDVHMTPTILRDTERSIAAGGSLRWTAYVRERATGTFAGFSEVVWNANRPHLLWQWGTGVVPEFRGNGLGRWLKAAMITRVLRERATVRFIRTGNADSNAPMLKINHELGFKPFIANTFWQIDLAQVQAYLANVPALITV